MKSDMKSDIIIRQTCIDGQQKIGRMSKKNFETGAAMHHLADTARTWDVITVRRTLRNNWRKFIPYDSRWND